MCRLADFVICIKKFWLWVYIYKVDLKAKINYNGIRQHCLTDVCNDYGTTDCYDIRYVGVGIQRQKTKNIYWDDMLMFFRNYFKALKLILTCLKFMEKCKV